MSRLLAVHLIPSLASPELFVEGSVAVFDVLRATTTIGYALAAGVQQVLPCVAVEEARALAATFPPGEALLGGERGGVKIEGFDLGNSPEEYTPRRCSGKHLVFTTTNGTRAMAAARTAQAVYLGALANVTAVAAALAQADRVHLLCAGTEGQISAEDVYAAGLVARQLIQGADWELNDEAILAMALAKSDGSALDVLRSSRGGRNLIDLGLNRDIEVASRCDVFDFVPRVQWDDSGQAHIVPRQSP